MNETITNPAAGPSESGNAVMSCDGPGAALSVAAEVLDTCGFGTRRAGGDESRALIATGLRDTACEISDDDGFLRWEYHPGIGPDQERLALTCWSRSHSPSARWLPRRVMTGSPKRSEETSYVWKGGYQDAVA